MLLGWFMVARAEPLVYDGDPAAAIAVAAQRGGADPGTLTPTPFANLLGGPPVLVAGGAAAGCSRSPSSDDALAKAESALLYGRLDEAAARIDDARDQILCATAPPSQSARVEVVAGLLAEERGDPAAAKARYQAALGYDRAVAWPDAYPSQRRALFDATSAAFAPAHTALQVRPHAPPATLDGAPMGEEVPVGEHVVRVGASAVRVALDEAPNRLVVPAAYPADSLTHLGDDGRRADLTALLAAAIGEGTELWVVDQDTAWHGIAGRTDWKSFGPPPLPDPVPLAPTHRSPARPIAGFATAALGIGLGIGGTWLTHDAASEAKGQADPEWTRQHHRYEAGIATLAVGWSLGGVGLVVGGSGFVR